MFSLFLYAFIYTPLKKVSAVSVLVGAVPGALPCLIGWAAGNDKLSAGGWILFLLQFMWQFPHFWAIAWVAHGDYTKAGFKLLPSEQGPTKYTAIQTIIWSLLLVPPETRVLTPLKHCPHLLEGQTLCMWRQGSTRATSRWDPARFTCVFAIQAAWRWLACYEVWHETNEWPLPEAK